MPRVIDELHRDHVNLAKLLAALERQVAAFDRGKRPDYDILHGVIDYCLTYPDLYHHPKEDLIMEHLRARDPAAAASLGDLLAEHARLGEVTRRFAAAVHNVLQEVEVPRAAFDEKARSFLQAYRDHMAEEERAFLPLAAKTLTAEDWREIDARMAPRPDPLFEGEPEDRFRALSEDILAWDREHREQQAQHNGE